MSAPIRAGTTIDEKLIEAIAEGILEKGWGICGVRGAACGPPCERVPTDREWALGFKRAFEIRSNELAEMKGEVAALELGNGELTEEIDELEKLAIDERDRDLMKGVGA